MLISDPSIFEALRVSGWTEYRQFDAALWLSELETIGYDMNEKSRYVLASLGGLSIQPVLSDSQVYKPSQIRFEPLLLKWLSRPISWERQLGSVLSPLGECYEDSSLFIDDDGRLYASWDTILECLGNDFEDSLSTLLFAKKRGRHIELTNSL
jgi:hypothetical protein